MLEAGEGFETCTNFILGNTDCKAGRNCRRRILRIVAAAKRLDTIEIDQ